MRKPLIGSMVVAAASALWWLAPPMRAEGPTPTAQGEGPLRAPRLHLPARVTEKTLVGYFHNTPPPWPAGNCFSLSPASPEDLLKRLNVVAGPRPGTRLHVINMHAENFEEVARKLKLETVEVERVGEAKCLVVDRRIDRAWLLDKPCTICNGKNLGEEVLAEHPEAFREATR
jgi:hypothetical protein